LSLPDRGWLVEIHRIEQDLLDDLLLTQHIRRGGSLIGIAHPAFVEANSATMSQTELAGRRDLVPADTRASCHWAIPRHPVRHHRVTEPKRAVKPDRRRS
jgi:hypothetical protein